MYVKSPKNKMEAIQSVSVFSAKKCPIFICKVSLYIHTGNIISPIRTVLLTSLFKLLELNVCIKDDIKCQIAICMIFKWTFTIKYGSQV